MSSDKELAKKVVDKMLQGDKFSAWLGIQVTELSPGRAVLKMKVRAEMLNGFGVAHGGIQYSFADSALAFAANGWGRKSLALQNSISYPAPVHENDELTAVAEELHLGKSTASYDITVTNQNNRKVALFRGTVFRTTEEWFPKE
ncbi:MAG: thioesterase [Proteobacteria bacterium]|nr:MAG: thioesterase [Pseudomonadota bacterium]